MIVGATLDDAENWLTKYKNEHWHEIKNVRHDSLETKDGLLISIASLSQPLSAYDGLHIKEWIYTKHALKRSYDAKRAVVDEALRKGQFIYGSISKELKDEVI